MDGMEQLTPQEVAAAGRVARVVELDTIAMVDGSFALRARPEDAKGANYALKVARVVKHEFVEGARQIDVRISFMLSGDGPRTEGSSALPALTIRATFLLRYLLGVEPPPVELREELFGAFAKVNGTYNAWPYLREFVQSSTARMQLSSITLPVFTVRAPQPAAVAPTTEPQPTDAPRTASKK